MSSRKYKPVSLDTSVRARERFKSLLSILNKHENKILTNDLCIEILKEVVTIGATKPLRFLKQFNLLKKFNSNPSSLTQADLNNIFSQPSGLRRDGTIYSQPGFAPSWPSRFLNIFKKMRCMGLVDFKEPGVDDSSAAPLLITDLGKELLSCVSQLDNPLYPRIYPKERLIFTNIIAKYHSNNPFYGVMNNTRPFVLVMEVIKLINKDKTLNPSKKTPSGIRHYELLFLISAEKHDPGGIFNEIKSFRKKYKADVSLEDTIKHVKALRSSSFSWDSSTKDHIDTFKRTMLITTIFSNDRGRNFSINSSASSLVNYIIKTYSKPQHNSVLNNRKDYFDFCKSIDTNIISFSSTKKTKVASHFLTDQVKIWSWEEICNELSNISNNKDATDIFLKTIDAPLRLEFLTAIALKQQFPSLKVEPGYSVDDYGTPTSFAGAGHPDIICKEGNNEIIIELTTIRSAQQIASEMVPIHHHLLDLINRGSQNKDYGLIFIAPIIHERSYTYGKFMHFEEDLCIANIKIEDFKNELSQKNNLKELLDSYQVKSKHSIADIKKIINTNKNIN